MEQVILDGVEYVKASAIAKQFHYTADYVGQLCRGKKVDARLVGRTWFVNPKSLTEHKKNKYSKHAVESESVALNNEERESVKVSVQPVLKSKTSKYLSTRPDLVESKRLKVRYERDEENLIPHITKKVILPPKTIRIEQADAKKIRVDGVKTPYSFEADPMPEVALSGKLKVESIPEPDTLEEYVDGLEETTGLGKTKKNIAISPKQEKNTSLETFSTDNKSLPVHSEINEHESKTEVSINKNTPKPPKKFSGITPRRKPAFESKSGPVPKNQIKFTPASLEKLQPVKISTAVLMSPLIATVLALVVVTALFSASSNLEVSSSSYSSKVVLQVANLMEVLEAN